MYDTLHLVVDAPLQSTNLEMDVDSKLKRLNRIGHFVERSLIEFSNADRFISDF